jgi:AAA15 family ATPase/GTPase
MLINFSITNYRSIKNKVSLSMLPTKAFKEIPSNLFNANDKFELLRSACIYGANASGKSNLLLGLINFGKFILESSDLKLEQPINLYDPFLLDTKSSKLPSKFEIEFFASDNTRYEYTLEITTKRIEFESLFFFPKGQRNKVFIRQPDSPIVFGSVIKGEKKSIESRLLDNQLFLSKAANEKIEALNPVYNYFKFCDLFDFQNLNTPVISITDFIGGLLKTQDSAFLVKLSNLIKALDTGIQSFDLKKTDQFPLFGKLPNEIKDFFNDEFLKEVPKELNFEISTNHNAYDEKGDIVNQVAFNLERESSGTKSLFTLATFILDSLDRGSIFVIDEFERNLHPSLVRFLIGLYHNPKINSKNAQILFTTHDTSLLNNEVFRRDQIWFTDKNTQGITELYSMSDISGIRNNIPYDKWYLSGRFGGTPVINESNIGYGNI